MILILLLLSSLSLNAQVIISYCIDNSVPKDLIDYVEDAFVLIEQYESFITVHDCTDLDTIHVYWIPIQGSPVGLAYAKKWGYEENKIELDSTYNVFLYEPEWITIVTMHELLHIILTRNHSRNRYDLLYAYAWRKNPLLGWGDLELMLTIFGLYRPIPQNLVTLGY